MNHVDDQVDGPDDDAAAGGVGLKPLENGPGKVKAGGPGLNGIIPSTSEDTKALNQSFDQKQLEKDASDTGAASKLVSSPPTGGQLTGRGEGKNLPNST